MFMSIDKFRLIVDKSIETHITIFDVGVTKLRKVIKKFDPSKHGPMTQGK